MPVLLKVDVGDEEQTSLLVEADRGDVPGDLVLASPDPGRAAAEATWTVYQALERLAPMLTAIHDQLSAAGPQSVAVEFGVKLGGETGVILAKGTAEVNLKITMTWERSGEA
jgi:Trypsin-co-occurring domain 1